MSEESQAAEEVVETPIEEVVESEEIEASAAPESEESNEELSPEEAEELSVLQEETQDAINNAESEEEVQEIIKEYRIKVHGKEFVKQFDPTDADEVTKVLQMLEANKHSMQEKAELEKLYKQELMGAKENPWEFLKQLGHDPDKLTEAYLEQKIEEFKKSPEELEKEKLMAEIQEMREREKQAREALEAEQSAKLQQEQFSAIQSEMDDVLSANTSSLPDCPRTRSKLAEAMLWAMDNEFEDVSVADVAPIVEQELQAEIREIFEALPLDFVEEYIGNSTVEKLRKKRLETLKKKGAEKIQPTTESIKKQEVTEVEKKSMKEFFRDM